MNVAEILKKSRGNGYTVRMPEGEKTVSIEGISAVWVYLEGQGLVQRSAYGWHIFNHHDIRVSVGNAAVNREGRFARRLAAWLYKTHQTKLSDGQVSEIGNIANRYLCSDGGAYDIAFVADMADIWTPGDYGDSGSCYFGSNRGAPPSIFESGGAGITVNKNGRGFGRAWICQPGQGDALALWNWYGRNGGDRWGLPQLCDLLTKGEGSPFCGAGFRAQKLGNRGCHTVYINTTGALLYAPDKAPEKRETVELRIDEVYVGVECCDCGRELDEDDAHYYDDEPYCGDCYPLYSCDRCGREDYRENMTYTDRDGDICEYCIERYYTTCHTCGDLIHDNDAHHLDDFRGHTYDFCSDCYPGVTCDECGSDFFPADLNRVANGSDVCEDCLRDNYTECYDCHENHENAAIVSIEQAPIGGHSVTREYCESCAEKYACDKCGDPVCAKIHVGEGMHVCMACYVEDYSLFDVAPQVGQMELV